MIRLVDDLLEAAAMETARFQYHKTPQDIKKIITQLVEIRTISAERKGIVFAFKKPKGRMPVMSIDEAAMKIALNNLLENAINYTPKGGKISVLMERNDSSLEIHIADTGIGVLPEDTERVFVKFFRGKNAMQTITSGAGLGLYIAKKIIEAHGGRISVRSNAGAGSVFSISLPLS